MALSASTASRGRSAPGWVLLDRAPHAGDLDPAGVLLYLVAPPAVSTALVDRFLFPDPDAAAADDDDDDPPRIQGADASGRVLFSFPTAPRALADSHLAICRPVTGRRGDIAKGKLTVVPAFPEEEFGHALSEAAPTGILFDPKAKGGDGFFVAQMRSAPPVAAVLIFSSEAQGWCVAEVPAEGRWHGFHATSVESHHRGPSAGFAFLDLRRRGILLLHPRKLAAARFIDLPVPEEGGVGEAIDEGRATIGFSDGRLVFVVFEQVDEGMLVRFWSLSEDERRWTSSRLSSELVFGRDARMWPLRGPPMLGPIDPNMSNRIVFADYTGSAFFLDVTPDELGLVRVSPRALDSVVFNIAARPKSTWAEAMTSAMEGGKRAGSVAWGAVQKARPYADNLPAVVEMVGAFGLPHAALALTTAKAIKNVNDYVKFFEYGCKWFWKHRPGAPSRLITVVGSAEEANQALEEWNRLKRPRHMEVRADPDMSTEVWNEICDFLKDNGAATLIQHRLSEWEMVSRPPN